MSKKEFKTVDELVVWQEEMNKQGRWGVNLITVDYWFEEVKPEEAFEKVEVELPAGVMRATFTLIDELNANGAEALFTALVKGIKEVKSPIKLDKSVRMVVLNKGESRGEAILIYVVDEDMALQMQTIFDWLLLKSIKLVGVKREGVVVKVDYKKEVYVTPEEERKEKEPKKWSPKNGWRFLRGMR